MSSRIFEIAGALGEVAVVIGRPTAAWAAFALFIVAVVDRVAATRFVRRGDEAGGRWFTHMGRIASTFSGLAAAAAIGPRWFAWAVIANAASVVVFTITATAVMNRPRRKAPSIGPRVGAA